MANKRRQVRIAERIKQEASGIILHELKDPRMGFVTVTGAHISPDLQRAQIYVSVLGEESEERKTMQALDHAKGFIQRMIAQRIGLRRAPVISIHVDDSTKKSARISSLIEQIKEEGEVTDEASKDEDTESPEPPSEEES